MTTTMKLLIPSDSDLTWHEKIVLSLRSSNRIATSTQGRLNSKLSCAACGTGFNYQPLLKFGEFHSLIRQRSGWPLRCDCAVTGKEKGVNAFLANPLI